MPRTKKVLTVLWIIIAILAVASITSLIIFPQWEGVFFAIGGGFLIFNILLSMFFIKRNYKN